MSPSITAAAFTAAAVRAALIPNRGRLRRLLRHRSPHDACGHDQQYNWRGDRLAQAHRSHLQSAIPPSYDAKRGDLFLAGIEDCAATGVAVAQNDRNTLDIARRGTDFVTVIRDPVGTATGWPSGFAGDRKAAALDAPRSRRGGRRRATSPPRPPHSIIRPTDREPPGPRPRSGYGRWASACRRHPAIRAKGGRGAPVRSPRRCEPDR
jgi:hypothetical protein